MIQFVNAKINIGLRIVKRRPDGYHDLQTIFYPVGLYAGTPYNPTQFCDIIEIVNVEGCADNKKFSLILSGNNTDCPINKNLVWRAAEKYFASVHTPDDFFVEIRLDKHLPDGAGMGGGSADAAFTLILIRQLHKEFLANESKELPSYKEMEKMALSLGADCPFFLYNKPCLASGVGEVLSPIDLDLSGRWLTVVKPNVSISTKEAFLGIVPKCPEFNLDTIVNLPIQNWKDHIVNDFETTIFKLYPCLHDIKNLFYEHGALYASLTGSGSCIYGIFENQAVAQEALSQFSSVSTISATYLLKM